MKKITLLFSFLFIYVGLFAQQNMTLVGQETFGEDANDIWGYVDQATSTEYAIIGVRSGTWFYDLTTPSTPLPRMFVPGPPSTWRDMKTWDKYTYVTADEGTAGLLIVDMSNVQSFDTLVYKYIKPTLTVNGVTGVLERAHNIYIDENGIAYISGSNIGEGEVLFFDVATDPYNPIYLGAGPAEYSHDNYTRDNIMYSGDINAGFFSVVDVTDKTNPILLATETTPFVFTHNTWLSDDGNTLFTTDERADAPVAAYDISDLNDIKLLDEFRPPATVGEGVIPHNVHVLGDFLVISYYSDGIIVVDATQPENLVQVGQYDTYTGPETGFNGCWGAYPFLPSGLVLASDISTGLYIFQANYERASYLEGTVTDLDTGLPIQDVDVTLGILDQVEKQTNLMGEYKMGLFGSDTFQITFDHPTYFPVQTEVILSSGVFTVLDIQMTPKIPFTLSGVVVENGTSTPVSNAQVKFENQYFTYTGLSDAAGNFSIPSFYDGSYNVYGGKWEYRPAELTNAGIDASSVGMTVELQKGIFDGFELDLGWTTNSTATTGAWERGRPVPADFFFDLTPGTDVIGDVGDEAYLTGNSNDPFTDNVQGGTVTLTSPVFDLSAYTEPEMRYSTFLLNYFLSQDSLQQGSSTLDIYITDGTTPVLVESLNTAFLFGIGWENNVHRISDYITPGPNMQVIFETSNIDPNYLLEAAVDFFRVLEGAVDVENPFENKASLNAFPNPSNGDFTVNYFVEDPVNGLELAVYNALGQKMETIILNNQLGQIQLGIDYAPGIYFIQMATEKYASPPVKLIKIK